MKFHYKVLIFALLFGASLIVEGCKPDRPGPGAGGPKQDVGKAIAECLKPSLVGILDSPGHVVDYVIRDSKWYGDMQENVCVGSAATPECWISSLIFLLDKHSPAYRAAAKCICEFSGKCEPITAQESTSVVSGMSLYDKWCKTPEKSSKTPLKKRFSTCISEEYAMLMHGHRKAGNNIGPSITTFLHCHYTFCKSDLTSKFSFGQRVTFQTLYLDALCPMPDTDDHWRGNILAIYEDATRQDSPMWNAINICNRKIYSNTELCRKAICKPNSKCVEKNGLAVCKCNEGYKEWFDGSCVEIDPCGSVECPALERCFAYRGRTYCVCQDRYVRGMAGKCEPRPDPCASDPCINGGECLKNDATYFCTCPDGYAGEICEISISNPCAKNPCQNGGICLIHENSYKCECAKGVKGKNCQKPPKCPGNKVYTACASQCTDSCEKRHSGCTADCDPVNHCVCPPGMVERRPGVKRCIPLDECPTPKCPGNKVHTDCASRCIDTCDKLHSDCTTDCDPDNHCVCPLGMVLLRAGLKRCVPLDECPGKPTKAPVPTAGFEEEVAEDPCLERFGKKCGRGSTCIMDKGKYTCVCEDGYAGDGFKCGRIRDRRGVCRVWGDPHYETFDRGADYYSFQGMCTYVLSETRLAQTDSRWFRAVAENEVRDNVTDVSWVKSATVYLYGEFGEEYMITIEKNGNVMLNGNNVVEGITPIFTIERSGRGAKVTTMHNVSISFNGDAVRVKVPASYKDELKGTCGNFNGDREDEFTMDNGEITDDSDEFAASHQFGECDKPLPPKVVCTEEDRMRWGGAAYCGLLKEKDGPFKECHGIVDTQVYFNTCVYDMCATKGNLNILNPALEQYVADCKNNGVDLCQWRATFDGKKTDCTRHSTYHGCASTCQDTCFNPLASADCDNTETVEGCVCDTGYVREGTKCVKLSDCGCVHNSIYYKMGETIYFDTEICNCESRNNFMCKCKPGYISEGGECKLRYAKGTCGFVRAELLATAVPNTFVPECDKDGNYNPKQCYDFTRECFCVHTRTGVTLVGTTMDSTLFNFRCDRLPVNCRFTNAIRLAGGTVSGFVPVCDEDGNYDTEQCDEDRMCYCVHRMTGVEVEGTKARLAVFHFDCDNIPINFGRCRKQHGKECSEYATCKSVPGGYQCVCDSAYTGDGFTCTGKDQCEISLGRKCHRRARCKSNLGIHRCVCKNRYAGDGYNCQDIEAKCREQHGKRCHRHGICTVVRGESYDCKCKEGYTGNGFKCRPMSECHKLAGVPCHSNARCERFEGSHQCKCKAGYQGNGLLCIKIDKCQEQLGRPCDRNAECGRNIGRTEYECRCRAGYTGNGLECREKSECHKRFKQPCDNNARCRQVAGYYRCICRAGYKGDGLACEEISPCEQMSGRKCHRDAECVRNGMGNYGCRCLTGFWGNGHFCGAGSPPANPCHRIFGRRCTDDATCEVTSDGRYFCRCNTGYVGDGFECQALGRRLCFKNLGRPCATNARCSVGGDQCFCKDGYSGDGFNCQAKGETQCQRPSDINQGIISSNNELYLLNTIITYTCVQGYIVKGDRQRTCKEDGAWSGFEPRCERDETSRIDAIPDRPHRPVIGDCHRRFEKRCHDFADCVFGSDGQVECKCRKEYTGNGFQCRHDALCSPPTGITFGNVQINDKSYNVNTVATFSCRDGYKLMGNKRRTCQTNGQWSGSQPRCEYPRHRPCSQPQFLDNGVFRASDQQYSDNSHVQYSCNAGFSLHGDSQRVCQNGEWSGTHPQCIRQ